MFALSIHDFFEGAVLLLLPTLCSHVHCAGISLGVQRDATNTFLMMAAFTSHKWVISGTVGLNWARSAVSTFSKAHKIL